MLRLVDAVSPRRPRVKPGGKALSFSNLTMRHSHTQTFKIIRRLCIALPGRQPKPF